MVDVQTMVLARETTVIALSLMVEKDVIRYIIANNADHALHQQ